MGPPGLSSSLSALLSVFLITAGHLVAGRGGQSSSGSSSSGGGPQQAPADFDCPEEFGYYPHPNDCSLYYVCVFGGALLESCTGGLMYSHELQTCDWPRNVGCGGNSELVSSSQQQQQPQRQQHKATVQQQPATPIIRQRTQSVQQQIQIPKADLYTEEEELGPAEELETDRQQRVYRGQPSTLGQVASDRDGLSAHPHSNLIPAGQSRGGQDKLSVVSYGAQQQYNSKNRRRLNGQIGVENSDHNFLTNQSLLSKAREKRQHSDNSNSDRRSLGTRTSRRRKRRIRSTEEEYERGRSMEEVVEKTEEREGDVSGRGEFYASNRSQDGEASSANNSGSGREDLRQSMEREGRKKLKKRRRARHKPSRSISLSDVSHERYDSLPKYTRSIEEPYEDLSERGRERPSPRYPRQRKARQKTGIDLRNEHRSTEEENEGNSNSGNHDESYDQENTQEEEEAPRESQGNEDSDGRDYEEGTEEEQNKNNKENIAEENSSSKENVGFLNSDEKNSNSSENFKFDFPDFSKNWDSFENFTFSFEKSDFDKFFSDFKNDDFDDLGVYRGEKTPLTTPSTIFSSGNPTLLHGAEPSTRSTNFDLFFPKFRYSSDNYSQVGNFSNLIKFPEGSQDGNALKFSSSLVSPWESGRLPTQNAESLIDKNTYTILNNPGNRISGSFDNIKKADDRIGASYGLRNHNDLILGQHFNNTSADNLDNSASTPLRNYGRGTAKFTLHTTPLVSSTTPKYSGKPGQTGNNDQNFVHLSQFSTQNSQAPFFGESHGYKFTYSVNPDTNQSTKNRSKTTIDDIVLTTAKTTTGLDSSGFMRRSTENIPPTHTTVAEHRDQRYLSYSYPSVTFQESRSVTPLGQYGKPMYAIPVPVSSSRENFGKYSHRSQEMIIKSNPEYAWLQNSHSSQTRPTISTTYHFQPSSVRPPGRSTQRNRNPGIPRGRFINNKNYPQNLHRLNSKPQNIRQYVSFKNNDHETIQTNTKNPDQNYVSSQENVRFYSSAENFKPSINVSGNNGLHTFSYVNVHDDGQIKDDNAPNSQTKLIGGFQPSISWSNAINTTPNYMNSKNNSEGLENIPPGGSYVFFKSNIGSTATVPFHKNNLHENHQTESGDKTHNYDEGYEDNLDEKVKNNKTSSTKHPSATKTLQHIENDDYENEDYEEYDEDDPEYYDESYENGNRGRYSSDEDYYDDYEYEDSKEESGIDEQHNTQQESMERPPKQTQSVAASATTTRAVVCKIGRCPPTQHKPTDRPNPLSADEQKNSEQTIRTITLLRASVQPIQQQVYDPRSYNTTRYVQQQQQYDPNYYAIYDEEAEQYKDIGVEYGGTRNGYGSQQKTSDYSRKKQPTVEIVPQEQPEDNQQQLQQGGGTRGAGAGSPYPKPSIYQSVTPQEYDSYTLQTNEDLPYRQVQTKSNSRYPVDVKESGSSRGRGERTRFETLPTVRSPTLTGQQPDRNTDSQTDRDAAPGGLRFRSGVIEATTEPRIVAITPRKDKRVSPVSEEPLLGRNTLPTFAEEVNSLAQNGADNTPVAKVLQALAKFEENNSDEASTERIPDSKIIENSQENSKSLTVEEVDLDFLHRLKTQNSKQTNRARTTKIEEKPSTESNIISHYKLTLSQSQPEQTDRSRQAKLFPLELTTPKPLIFDFNNYDTYGRGVNDNLRSRSDETSQRYPAQSIRSRGNARHSVTAVQNERSNPESNARWNGNQNERNNPESNPRWNANQNERNNPESNPRWTGNKNERNNPESNPRWNGNQNERDNPESSPRWDENQNERNNHESNPRWNGNQNRGETQNQQTLSTQSPLRITVPSLDHENVKDILRPYRIQFRNGEAQSSADEIKNMRPKEEFRSTIPLEDKKSDSAIIFRSRGQQESKNEFIPSINQMAESNQNSRQIPDKSIQEQASEEARRPIAIRIPENNGETRPRYETSQKFKDYQDSRKPIRYEDSFEYKERSRGTSRFRQNSGSKYSDDELVNVTEEPEKPVAIRIPQRTNTVLYKPRDSSDDTIYRSSQNTEEESKENVPNERKIVAPQRFRGGQSKKENSESYVSRTVALNIPEVVDLNEYKIKESSSSDEDSLLTKVNEDEISSVERRRPISEYRPRTSSNTEEKTISDGRGRAVNRVEPKDRYEMATTLRPNHRNLNLPPTTLKPTRPPKKFRNGTQYSDLTLPIGTDTTDNNPPQPDPTIRTRPMSFNAPSSPGSTRGGSRHRGSQTYTISPNEAEPISQPRGTPPPQRGRPTLKPSTTVVGKATEYQDVYRFPPRRPDNVYPTPQVDKTAAKCRKDVCLLPDCYCGGKEVPGELSPEETPQIVLLTFDDSVNDLNKGLYSDLFEKGRVNPNGCPISATFYVSHEWTDYSQVQNLYAAGHEIASHSVSHSFGEQFSQKKWTREIAGQREILAAYGGVKLEDVRGMRAPFLAVGGNKMFKMLYDSNFTYDSSMPVYENRPPSWPYTLDYKIFHDCMIPPCPTKSYPGVWEVPMVMWQDLNGGRCSMGDACSNPPDSEGVYKMLVKNFERHFTSNRAPFGLFYHAAWFTQPHHKEGFIAFLDTINKMPEVWIITNWQAIQWVRDPTPLSRLANFAPFQCHYPDRPKKCNNPKVCNLWHKSGVRYMRTCQACPEVYPWTGKSGVRNSRIDNDLD